MKILQELLAVLRPSAAAPEPGKRRSARGGQQAAAEAAPAAPALGDDYSEVMAALVKLSTEREALREAQATASAKREALLIEDGRDEEIDAAERDMDRATRRIEVLDELEPQLQARARALLDEIRRERLDGLVRADCDLVGTLVKALRQLAAVQQARRAVRMEADEAGLAAEASLHMPPPLPLAFDWYAIADNLEVDLRRRIAAAQQGDDDQPPGLVLRFVKRSPPYLEGEMASFPTPFAAWSFVRAGVAEWVNPDEVPPVPPMPLALATDELRKLEEVEFLRDGFAEEGGKAYRAGARKELPAWFARAAVHGGFARYALGHFAAAEERELQSEEGA